MPAQPEGNVVQHWPAEQTACYQARIDGHSLMIKLDSQTMCTSYRNVVSISTALVLLLHFCPRPGSMDIDRNVCSLWPCIYIHIWASSSVSSNDTCTPGACTWRILINLQLCMPYRASARSSIENVIYSDNWMVVGQC